MLFSVVTISFNQKEFLGRTIESVLGQQGVDVEYIVVDAGSTDGSRAVIESYGDRIAHRIFSPDDGPADGLNKGFARAGGDVYCYLNSDDTFAPGALARIRDYLASHADVDVVCGHAWIVDRHDRHVRRMWSGRIDRKLIAYGVSDQVQPSTFIRAAAFRRTNGFNPANRSNWDAELMTDLIGAGARIRLIDAFLSNYRLHGDSITNSGKLMERIEAYYRRRFETLMGRGQRPFDRWIKLGLRVREYGFHPKALWERITRGPIYRRGLE